MRRPVALLAAAALLPVAGAGAAPARTTLNDVEDEVMCVSCRVPLNIAESPQADQERGEIRTLVAQGLTKQQIKDRLVAIYGDEVLAQPKAKGFDVLAYAVPIGAGAAIVLLLVLLLPRWRRAARAQGEPDEELPALDPVAERRLAEDLARYEA